MTSILLGKMPSTPPVGMLGIFGISLYIRVLKPFIMLGIFEDTQDTQHSHYKDPWVCSHWASSRRAAYPSSTTQAARARQLVPAQGLTMMHPKRILSAAAVWERGHILTLAPGLALIFPKSSPRRLHSDVAPSRRAHVRPSYWLEGACYE